MSHSADESILKALWMYQFYKILKFLSRFDDDKNGIIIAWFSKVLSFLENQFTTWLFYYKLIWSCLFWRC